MQMERLIDLTFACADAAVMADPEGDEFCPA
jgi:hypothetical protein